MAETWKVQLNDEEAHGGGVYCGGSIATACTNNTGKFNFASPSTGVNNYTITYTNGTQTTTTSFTVNAGDCVKCDCDKIEFTATEVNGQGGDGVQLGTFRVTSEFCKNAFTVTASAVSGGFVTNPRISGNKVLGNVGVNEGAPRNLKFNLLINNNTCPQTTTQKTGCNCNSITHTPVSTVTSFDGNGFTGKVATYSVSTGCDINKVGIQGDTNVYSLTTEGSTHIVKASVGANTGTAERSFSYKLTYNNSPCEGKGRTIAQGIACDCNNFQFVAEEGGSIYIPASGGCEISLGKITGSTKNCQYTYQNCTISETTFGDNDLSIDGYDSEKGLIGSIQQNNGDFNDGAKIKSAKLTVSATDTAGDICTAKPFYLRQYASLTDNDSAMQNNDCAVHALRIDAAGTGGGNDKMYLMGSDSSVNWRDYFEYSANVPFPGQSAAPTGVKDQDGDTITGFDTNAVRTVNEPYFDAGDGYWHFSFDVTEHSGAKRYAVIYLHNKKFGTPGNIYQEYGWIIAGQPMRD